MFRFRSAHLFRFQTKCQRSNKIPITYDYEYRYVTFYVKNLLSIETSYSRVASCDIHTYIIYLPATRYTIMPELMYLPIRTFSVLERMNSKIKICR